MAPAVDDVTPSTALWCQPCLHVARSDKIRSLEYAMSELKMAIRATIPLANRFQRHTLV